jgi:hypothetical protein
MVNVIEVCEGREEEREKERRREEWSRLVWMNKKREEREKERRRSGKNWREEGKENVKNRV